MQFVVMAGFGEAAVLRGRARLPGRPVRPTLAPASTGPDDDALVAEVGDQFMVAAKRLDIPREAADGGPIDLTVPDLADPRRGHSPLVGNPLVPGRFRLDLTIGSTRLGRQGDYVIWGPGIGHSWQAEQDSVVVTVRWPSIPAP